MRSVSSKVSFAAVLALTMAISTFAFVGYGVLASALIAEFGVARWQVGALVTATALAGAVFSPPLGTVADRIGARPATVACMIASGLTLLALAVSPVFWVLTIMALASGVSQAMANPATNKLISNHAAPGRRGIITGVKQSGVQAGIFVGGLALPPLAVTFGWRWAVIVFAAVALAGAWYAYVRLPHDPPPHPEAAKHAEGDLPPLIRRLALYGFALGAGGIAITTYLPLFVEEQLGFPRELAGTAIAVAGLTGAVARIAWGPVAETRIGVDRSLRIMAGLAIGAALVLVFAEQVGWLVWVGAVLTGLSVSSWNTVGMLAVIDEVPAALAGRGSGVVLLGFLAGLGVGAPAMGWSVDQWGSYRPGWSVVAVLFALGLASLGRSHSRPVAVAEGG